MRDELIRRIVRDSTGQEVRNIRPLDGGQVGHVFRADTDGASFAVKFVSAAPEAPFANEPRDDRVYGARWSNLRPAHRLLKSNGIAVPEIHATGTLPDEGLHFAVMDYLDGDADDYSPEWFAALGAGLAGMHRITRAYQGWVAMDGPYAEPWPDAFAASLRQRFTATEPLLDRALSAAIGRFIAGHRKISEPASFVLSHTDGFQGVFRRGPWRLLGVIDIEDHQFTDPHFVLAGLELSHAFHGRAVPPQFWDAYARAASAPGDFQTTKGLFQLYYLLVWTRVLKADRALYDRCVFLLEDLTRNPQPSP